MPSRPSLPHFKTSWPNTLIVSDNNNRNNISFPLANLLLLPGYEHSNGMNQFIAWTALANEGLGCNLQHFHPTISKGVAETWEVPANWSLRAQLVFGKPTGPPRGGVEKQFAPLEPRVKVYGKKE